MSHDSQTYKNYQTAFSTPNRGVPLPTFEGRCTFIILSSRVIRLAYTCAQVLLLLFDKIIKPPQDQAKLIESLEVCSGRGSTTFISTFQKVKEVQCAFFLQNHKVIPSSFDIADSRSLINVLSNQK